MTLVTNETLKEKFENFRKNLKESQSSRQIDKRMIDFRPGNTYSFRLLYTESPNRNSPFITKWIHGFKDENDKYRAVVCPKTEFEKSYLQKCCICKNNVNMYDNGSTELYSKYKAKFHGYALVYVINDPLHPENNDHVKVMHFDEFSRDVLYRKVFGIVAKPRKFKTDEKPNTVTPSPVVEADEVGFDAFSIDAGYNLNVTVSAQGKFNRYEFDFARKPTALPQENLARLHAEIEEIKFDSYIEKFSEEKIKDFYEKYIIGIPTITSQVSEELSNALSEANVSQNKIVVNNTTITSKNDIDNEIIPGLEPVNNRSAELSSVYIPSAVEDNTVSLDEIDKLLEEIK